MPEWLTSTIASLPSIDATVFAAFVAAIAAVSAAIVAARAARGAADRAAQGAKDAADRAAQGAKDAADRAARGATEAADRAAQVAKDAAEVAARGATEAADRAAQGAKDAAEVAAAVKRESETLSRLLVANVAPSMIGALKRLWAITSLFAASQTSPADLASRSNFIKALTEWYYTEGNGLFLSSRARDALFRVRCSALRREEARARGFDLDHDRWGPKTFPESDQELVRDLRNQVSILRSALKGQLGIFGVWSDDEDTPAVEASKR